MMLEIEIEKLIKFIGTLLLLFDDDSKKKFSLFLLQIGPLNRLMDFHLKGHPYVKSPIDMACWDILGKVRKHIF